MADRGYVNLPYFARIAKNGAGFIVRGKTNLDPTVTAAWDESGRKRKRFVGPGLKKTRGFPKRSVTDLDVRWNNVDGQPLTLRVVVFWSPKEQRHSYLITNLDRSIFSARQVLNLYALRWQIELYFKEWKSYANLHAFDTENENIAEGLIWAAIAAAICKRFFAHATQLLTRTEISTRKVAMCFHHVADAVFEAIVRRSNKALLDALAHAVAYLAVNATRAHPKRDRTTGRLARDLQPVFGCA